MKKILTSMGKKMSIAGFVLLFVALISGCGQIPLGESGKTGLSDKGDEPNPIDIRGIIESLDVAEHNPNEDEKEEPVDPNTSVSSDQDTGKNWAPKEYLGFIFVEGKIETDTQYDKASVTIKDSTQIFKKEGEKLIPASFHDLRVGDRVEIQFSGPVAESYPVQTQAGKIVILPES